MKKWIILLFLIILLNLGIRYYIWDHQDDIYKDENGITYPLTHDSYSYLNKYQDTPKIVVYLYPILFTILSIVLIFLIASLFLDKYISLIITLLFSLSISFMSNTLIGLIDKNPIVFCLFAAIVFFSLFFLKSMDKTDKQQNTLNIILIIILTIILISVIFPTSNPIKLVSLVKEATTVNELQPVWTKLSTLSILFQLIFLILAFFYSLYDFIMNRVDSHRFLLLILFSISILIGCSFYKYFYFTMLFAYIYLGFILKDTIRNIRKNRYIFYITLSLIMLILAFGSINLQKKPLIDDTYPEAMAYVNTLNKSKIFNFWSYGVIYYYYTNKEVRYHGHPADLRKQYNFFVYGNRTILNHYYGDGYIFVFNQKDYNALDYLTQIWNENISRADYYINTLLPNATLFQNEVSKIWVIP